MVSPEQFMASRRWTFAKTMPEHPHEYTVRRGPRDAEFEAFVRYVLAHGYEARFGGRAFTYLLVTDADGVTWRCWSMVPLFPPEKTTILNRARHQPGDHAAEIAAHRQLALEPGEAAR